MEAIIVPIEINSKAELYNHLNTFDFSSVRDCKMASVYFLVEHDSKVWPMHFMPFKDVWFESPCSLHKFPLKDDEVSNLVISLYDYEMFQEAYELEKRMQKNGWHYSIENFQCSPFLPEKITILDVFSDEKCLEWLLEHAKT